MCLFENVVGLKKNPIKAYWKKKDQIPTPTNVHRELRLARHLRQTMQNFTWICQLHFLVSGPTRSKSICMCRSTNLHMVSGTQQPIMSGYRADTVKHACIIPKWQCVWYCNYSISVRSVRQHVKCFSVFTFNISYKLQRTWIFSFFFIYLSVRCRHGS